jgi:HD-GYP domain-containing protein (c-di-GMP phosphodiesterase class II)
MIPDIARMLGICDIFDALISKRTFRFSYSSYEAFLLMKDEMRGKIDNRYLNLFIQIFTE